MGLQSEVDPINLQKKMNKTSNKNLKLAITRVLMAGVAILLTADRASSANPRSLSGVVQTGGTSSSEPLPNVNVTLFEATRALPTALGQATTDASGRFTIPYRRSRSSSIFFVKADVGEGVSSSLSSARTCASVTINELTTVAAGYSMAQFFRTGVISGNSFGLRIAAGMNDNIVASATGESSPVLLSRRMPTRRIHCAPRSLANLLAACVGNRVVAEPFRSDHAAGRSPATQYRPSVGEPRSRPGAERGWDLQADVAEQLVCAAARY